MQASILNWTIFDGFNITANYQRLKEVGNAKGETNTRIAIEDPIANIAAEYHNYVQQKLRLNNFRYAVSLSKERLRIVEERYHIGNFSRPTTNRAKWTSMPTVPIYETAGTAAHLTYPAERTHGKQRCRPAHHYSRQPHQRDRPWNFEELWNATLTINASC